MSTLILLFVALMLITWAFNIIVLTSTVLFFTVDEAYGIFNSKALALIKLIIGKLKLNPSYIFLDLDKLHDLNEAYGHAVVDRMIKTSFNQFRRMSLMRMPDFIFRYYSGDEFLIIVFGSNGLGAAHRCLETMVTPLSATVCVSESIEDAVAGCEYMKRNNLRGRIMEYKDIPQSYPIPIQVGVICQTIKN